MFKYFATMIGITIASIGLLTPHLDNRKKALQTSPCLKCDEGVGQLKKSANGKYSYECDNCGSTWVERR
tara:strand:+ start:62425 stop:62631 length:207 start_codon:yes stop_codon:yes gene_type:complete